MEIVRTIRDEDIGSVVPVPRKYHERSASRAVVFDDDGNVALLDVSNIGYHKLPGGGIEQGEAIETALRREISEEIGCAIKNIRELGIIEEFRNAMELRQVSYCYLAEIDGPKGEPHLEQDEIEEGFRTVWVSLYDAIQILRSEATITHYEGRFIRSRDLTILEIASKVG